MTDPLAAVMYGYLAEIERVNERLGLRQSSFERHVAEALLAGRCAFLVDHYQDEALAWEACVSGSLDQAIESRRAFFIGAGRQMQHVKRLDNGMALNSLVPLNSEAVSQLMDAYQRIGTFRTRRELMHRAFRLGWEQHALVAAE